MYSRSTLFVLNSLVLLSFLVLSSNGNPIADATDGLTAALNTFFDGKFHKVYTVYNECSVFIAIDCVRDWTFTSGSGSNILRGEVIVSFSRF